MGTNSKEYMHRVAEKYYKNPKARARNAFRKAARRIMEKKGLVKPFDGKEVDHKRGIGWGNWDWNLRVITRLRNRIAGQKAAQRAKGL